MPAGVEDNLEDMIQQLVDRFREELARETRDDRINAAPSVDSGGKSSGGH